MTETKFEAGTRVASSYSETVGQLTGNSRVETENRHEIGLVKYEVSWQNGKVTWVSEKVIPAYVANAAA